MGGKGGEFAKMIEGNDVKISFPAAKLEIRMLLRYYVCPKWQIDDFVSL